jgi:acyl-coenzyme A synthetase/AMP-(fatty) acid ligase
MIEEALASHPSVAECAVIGIPDEIKVNFLSLSYNL